MRSGKHGRIAFITTPKFRESCREEAKRFIYHHLYSLCRHFSVISTGRTYDFVKEIINTETLDSKKKELIEKDTNFSINTKSDFDKWKNTIIKGIKKKKSGYSGMIQIAYDLVEGRLDAIIHLTDWEDKSAKADSAVLSREANVHNVPNATDTETAKAYLETWLSYIVKPSKTKSIFRKRKKIKSPLKGIEKEDKVIAMVAHDNMKLEICRFAVKNATHVFSNYDYILATGTTGKWIKKFMEATGRSPSEVDKIRCCLSGPLGGDLQIAYTVVEDLCRKIIFLQDPSVSHPHDSDIRLFEQAVLHPDVKVELATNTASARLLIGL